MKQYKNCFQTSIVIRRRYYPNPHTMTIPTVEEVVEEFDKKTNPENYYNDDIKHGQGIYELKDTDGLLNICYYPDSPYEIEKQKVIDWLRTTLTTYGNARFEEGVSDCKHKAETAALMALNACGVPEEEAVRHARITVESVF